MHRASFFRLFLIAMFCWGVFQGVQKSYGYEYTGSLLGPCEKDFASCTYDIYQYDMWETLKTEPCLSSLVYDFKRLRTAELIYLLHRVQIDRLPLSAFCNKQKTRPLSLKQVKKLMAEHTYIDEIGEMTYVEKKGCIGAIISRDERANSVVVRELMARSSAYKSGMRQYDVIQRVDGVVIGGDVERATQHLRGAPESFVRVQLKRGEVVLNKNVLRKECDNQQMEWALCHGVGYIHVLEFSYDIFKENLKNSLLLFYANGVEGIVIDLRGNPGGFVTVARMLAEEFLPAGTVVYSEYTPYKGGEMNVVKTFSEGSFMYWLADMPVVILVDYMTASASEIFAGAIPALLVGERTYGKGVGQSPVHLSDGSKMLISSFFWYLPTGENISQKGLYPHVTKTEAEALASDRVLKSCLFPEDRELRYAIELLN
jgi:carboxyl-terminal processing protease